ncbi:wd40 repeat-containing protein [Nannochloropsis oceanica]
MPPGPPLSSSTNAYGPASVVSSSLNDRGAGAPRVRRPKRKKPLDPTGSIMLQMEGEPFWTDWRDKPVIQPHSSYFKYLTPPAANLHNPISSLPLFHLRSIVIRDKEKQKGPIFVAKWDPTGRRLLTGSESGYVVVIQGTPIKTWMAHDNAIKCMQWSANGNFMLTGARNGIIKYWARLNSVSAYDLKAHDGEVTAVSFAPSDTKDIKSAQWHPHKALVASCSKDSTVKLWDPRAPAGGRCVNTLYGHKSQVFKVAFNPNGRWLLSGGQDALIKMWDLRMMAQDMATLRGHRREISCLAWHPFHETLLVSGDKEGCLLYWLTDLSDRPQAEVYGHARDRAVWDLDWHPLGHTLASVGHDHMCKFWARSRPGDPLAGDANEYEHATLLGGIRPLLLEEGEEDEDEDEAGGEEGEEEEEEEEEEEGNGGKKRRRKKKKRREGDEEVVELPGVGATHVMDKTVVATTGPNSLNIESVRANLRDQNIIPMPARRGGRDGGWEGGGEGGRGGGGGRFFGGEGEGGGREVRREGERGGGRQIWRRGRERGFCLSWMWGYWTYKEELSG